MEPETWQMAVVVISTRPLLSDSLFLSPSVGCGELPPARPQ